MIIMCPVMLKNPCVTHALVLTVIILTPPLDMLRFRNDGFGVCDVVMDITNYHGMNRFPRCAGWALRFLIRC